MSKLIIFDFDGTLADSLSVSCAIISRNAKRFGYELRPEEIAELLKTRSILELMKTYNIQHWKIPFLLWYVRREYRQQVQNIRPFPKLRAELKTLKKKGYHLGIVSSNSKATIKTYCERHKLAEYIDFIEQSSLFNKEKAISRIIRKSESTYKSIIYVGDEVRDIEACLKTTAMPIAVSWGFNGKELLKAANPERILSKVSQLSKL